MRWKVAGLVSILAAVLAAAVWIPLCRSQAQTEPASQLHEQAAGENFAQEGLPLGAPPQGEERPKSPEEMLEDSEPSTQLAGAEQLAKSVPLLPPDEAEKVVRLLGEVALDAGRDLTVRQMATRGVGTAFDRLEVARELLKKLAEDPDPQIRQTVAEVLRDAKATRARDELLKWLSKDADAVVRGVATRVRIEIAAAQAGPEAIKEIVSCLGRSEGDASAQAAIQLIVKGGERPKDVLPYLIEALRTSNDGRQRHAAALCIAMICAGENPQQQKFGRLARTTKKTAVRLHKAVVEGVQPLIEALNDPDPYVREVAAQGLGYIGDERAAPALARALSDSVVWVRRRAASALVTVPAKKAQKALERAAIHDSDATVRRYAVEALGWIEDESVIPTLIAATKDANARVRRFAAQELGRRKARQALDALISLFDDPDEDVRWQAVLAVGKLRDPRAIDALVKALDDPAPQVANAAERALQRLGIAKRKEKYLKG